MTSHFSTLLEIAERCRFYKLNQQERETVLAYAEDLKKLATHCNFGANLKEALWDKFVCGLQNVQIQTRFLSEAKLKYGDETMKTVIRNAS